MKKILLFISVVLLCSACRVGTYSFSSGREDKSAISFVSPKPMNLNVTLDGQTYKIKSAKQKEYKTDRKLQKTVNATINTMPGKHTLKVTSRDGRLLIEKQIFLSTNETKMIEL